MAPRYLAVLFTATLALLTSVDSVTAPNTGLAGHSVCWVSECNRQSAPLQSKDAKSCAFTLSNFGLNLFTLLISPDQNAGTPTHTLSLWPTPRLRTIYIGARYPSHALAHQMCGCTTCGGRCGVAFRVGVMHVHHVQCTHACCCSDCAATCANLNESESRKHTNVPNPCGPPTAPASLPKRRRHGVAEENRG
jgi:hypothetical protein